MNQSSNAVVIDFRSDTVTKPTKEMRRVMAEAVVGDDVLGDDPTVIALQEKFAQLLGKEAACFVPTGTMANQTAIRAQTEPGDEIICHEGGHIIHYETGSPAALSGCMVRPLRGERGIFDVQDVEEAMRPSNIHSPHSQLLMLENTHNRGGGSVWPIEQLERVTRRGRELGLRLHLDGARLWNACAATGLSPKDYARNFDTVSCCFSKGLGCPAGSVVAGDRATIARVHRFTKMFGGKMRQSGVLAAAALYALENHRARLTEDHANARRLATLVAQTPGLVVDAEQRERGPETNMVFAEVRGGVTAAEVCERAKERGVLMLANGPRRIRAVCHLDVTREMIEEAGRRLQDVMQSLAGRSAAAVG
jgi:threonine aldolase